MTRCGVLWQREFYAQPQVFVTVDADGAVFAAYATREAAEMEVAWRKAQGAQGARVQTFHLHSPKLAAERWA